MERDFQTCTRNYFKTLKDAIYQLGMQHAYMYLCYIHLEVCLFSFKIFFILETKVEKYYLLYTTLIAGLQLFFKLFFSFSI